MAPNAANELSEEAEAHLRVAGLRLLGWPLLNVGGMIYCWILPRDQFHIHFDPTVLVVALLAWGLLAGRRRCATPAFVCCLTLLVAGLVLVGVGLLLPTGRVTVSGFVVLFEVSRHSALTAVCINGALFGWPLVPLLRFRRAISAQRAGIVSAHGT